MTSSMLKTMLSVGLCLGMLLIVACDGSKERLEVDAILHNIKMVDLHDGSLIENKAVVVNDGRISEVFLEEHIQDYATETMIDGGGAFLIPALADAHVHIQNPSELRNFVRYGVGLVVNMAGGPQHLDMREAVASGALLGPRIVTVGPTLDGDPPTNPLFTTVTPDTAEEIVQWIAAQGYDAFKVYQQMDAATLAAVISAAKDQERVTTGHVSREIGIAQALDLGQRYIAHGEELAFEAFDEASRSYDVDSVPALADRLSQAEVTVTPMLAYLKNIPAQVRDLQGYLEADEMRLLPAATRMSFDRRQGWFANREDPVGFMGQIESLADFVEALTVELQDRGVRLILGTDAGFGGAVPGHSVHQELEALVHAGLSELAALQTATRNVGEYLMQIDATHTPWGKIKPGYAASLLLIGGNPIRDITATQDIRGVMMDGHWVDQDGLETMEEDLVRRQQILLPLAQAFEDALAGGNLEAARAAYDAVPEGMTGESLVSADNCIFLGYRHYYGGNRPLAGRLYELCAAMHPTSAPLWIHIAKAFESEDRVEEALGAYARALELNPWYEDPQAATDRLSAEESFEDQ